MPTPEEITRHDYPEPSGGQSAWVDGARPEQHVEVVVPDPCWPHVYDAVAGRIREALGDRLVSIDHVGSTSVAGLPAKPTIDIDLTVRDSADEDAFVPDLEAMGFELRIREPWWHEHRGLRLVDPATNLHVFGPEAPEPVRHRIFRDWLREHPDDRELYAVTKRRAAADAEAAGEHVMHYNARKQQVIREIYDRAFRAAGLLHPGRAGAAAPGVEKMGR